jgi:hypothetical protein
MEAPGKPTAGVNAPVGAWAAGACQKSDGQDVGLPGCLKGDDLHGDSACSGGGRGAAGLDLGLELTCDG